MQRQISSNVNEVIRAILNFLRFFYERFHTHIRTKRKVWGLQTKSSHPTFRQYILTIGESEDSCVKLRSSHLN